MFPHNKTLKWTWEKAKDKTMAFRRKVLSTSLVFVKQDFEIIYNLLRSQYKCDKIRIEIHRICDGAFNIFYEGYLATVDGDYNVDQCRVEIKVRQEDEYSCILKDYTNEKDFIGGIGAPPAVNPVRFTQGEIEYITCSNYYYTDTLPDASEFTPNSSCITDPDTWGFLYNSIENVSYQIIPNTNVYEYYYEVVSYFAREKITLPCTQSPFGSGWVILINDCPTTWTWVRPVYNQYIASSSPVKNGRKLNDVIQFLLNECGYTFVSDFFGANPDDTNPDNFAYDYAKTFLQSEVIWQKSDVKRKPRVLTDSNGNTTVLPYESATKALIKLKDLLTYLYYMYNVQWRIIGNTFRIEHYTYWNSEKQNIIDLTQNNRIKGLHKFKFNTDEIPQKERWLWMEETDKSDFDGLPIIYAETCSYDGDTNETEYPIQRVTTNIEYIIANQDKIDDAGFVIGAVESSVFISDVCLITGDQKVNGPNSLANLLYYFHRHGRPQRQGNMNGTDTDFYRPLPTRTQDGITVPICCDELESLDVNFRVKTQLGWGEMASIDYEDPSGILSLSLLHE